MTESLLTTVRRLVIAALVFWILLAVPARRLGLESVFLFSAVALALCLSVALAGAVIQRIFGVPYGPRSLIILAFIGIRPVFVVGGATALATFEPIFQSQAFWAWLVTFYFGMLTRDLAELYAATKLQPNYVT